MRERRSEMIAWFTVDLHELYPIAVNFGLLEELRLTLFRYWLRQRSSSRSDIHGPRVVECRAMISGGETALRAGHRLLDGR